MVGGALGVGGLLQNQSTPGAETGDRESVPPPENEGTLAAADVAGVGLTNNGSGGGGELRAKEASNHPDSSSELDTDTHKRPPNDSLDDEHVVPMWVWSNPDAPRLSKMVLCHTIRMLSLFVTW
jgi:hypothetical protein